MWLMVVYVALTITGSFIAYGLGLVIERPQLLGISVEQSLTTVSLAVFLAAYFLNLWGAWLLAVRLTRPKPSEA